MSYSMSVTVDRPYAETVDAVRSALGEQGFGVLTEIDLQATLKSKLDVEIAPQVILGACRPPLAYASLQAEPSIGLLLPCNVVVRSLEHGRTTVEILDPNVMVGLTGNAEIEPVADEARRRLQGVLAALAQAAA